MEGGGGGLVAIDWVVPISTLGIAVVAVFSWAWWLSGKFTEMRKEFMEEMKELGDKILDKIEYHERHDDARFNNIQNGLFKLELAYAKKEERT